MGYTSYATRVSGRPAGGLLTVAGRSGGGYWAVTEIDNGDGTLTLTSFAITDNGDGTYQIAVPPVLSNGDGTLSIPVLQGAR